MKTLLRICEAIGVGAGYAFFFCLAAYDAATGANPAPEIPRESTEPDREPSEWKTDIDPRVRIASDVYGCFGHLYADTRSMSEAELFDRIAREVIPIAKGIEAAQGALPSSIRVAYWMWSGNRRVMFVAEMLVAEGPGPGLISVGLSPQERVKWAQFAMARNCFLN